jgi:hypothetical protein
MEIFMVYTDIEKEKLKNFFASVNEMIGGRFILSDVKVAKVLKNIASSEVLYNLFAKCLVNFNFEQEFSRAKVSNRVNGGYFTLPVEEDKIVALVFCMLLEIDNQKLNLQGFVTENFFSADGYNISYSNFALSVLVPFKNCVMSLLGVDEEGECVTTGFEELQENQTSIEDFMIEEEEEEEYEDETLHVTKILFSNMRVVLYDMLTLLNEMRVKDVERDELTILIRGMLEAVELENFKVINAFLVAFERIIGKNKFFRNDFEELKRLLADFYYNQYR